MKIAFDRNKYGVAARATLVADYVEACAWKYGRYQLDDMESLLRHIGRARIGDAHIVGTTASEGEADWEEDAESNDDSPATDVLTETSDDPQRHVISVLRERREELGDSYPFDLDDTAVTWRRLRANAYDSLLAITLAHAFGIESQPKVTEIETLFERVSARCLEGTRWTVHDVGQTGRAAGSFETALESIGDTLGWKLHPGATSRSTSAQEEGCDTLLMLPWRDSRPGRVFLIGQATVAKSDEWKRKIKEPSPTAWARRLQRPGHPPPIPFLTVPHHVERNTLIMLQEHSNGIVVDRIRLASGDRANELSEPELSVVELVRSMDIEI